MDYGEKEVYGVNRGGFRGVWYSGFRFQMGDWVLVGWAVFRVLVKGAAFSNGFLVLALGFLVLRKFLGFTKSGWL